MSDEKRSLLQSRLLANRARWEKPEKETEARAAIIQWAKTYFASEIGDPTPEVEVVSITHDEADDEWEVELSVSTSVDNPFVTFWLDDAHQLTENRIHVQQVEY